ncbi:beta-lactamase superfamily domain-containing protein [Podospora didyma]|uniref:Beta-lactamase superfamily domain-containing protein n=1 Tax=Podospora didyma TaxID=330526 RepID=A0AAE0P427_9PEZI|nr:beta-lactamase superfamily domain-containing protein [Podospora didyma]
MAPTTSFNGPLSITHVGTATAIIHVDGVNFLTDPVFAAAGSEWDLGFITLKVSAPPALTPSQLPPIDAVLLSHEDHVDNLDELGRLLLDGRKVLTTVDGANKLAPRPGVQALKPWETISIPLGPHEFSITGTPCVHLPGGEVTGFVVTTPSFGVHAASGLPNAIYFSGDTIYLPELGPKIRERFHVAVALLNIGKATAPLPDGPMQITLDGAQASHLLRDLGADLLVPMHFESWGHFYEKREELAAAFEKEGIQDKVLWLEPGVKTEISA